MQGLVATSDGDASVDAATARSLKTIAAALEPALGREAVDALLSLLRTAIDAGAPEAIRMRLDQIESVMDAVLLARGAE